MKLHLGCGGVRLDGFVNIDCRPGKAVDIVHNLGVDGLPPGVRPNSVSRIETYHFLEHIHRKLALKILRQCFEAMKPGAMIVIEVPDLEEQCRQVLAGNTYVIRNIYGLQRDDRPAGTDIHCWGYTADSLGEILEKIGFVVTRTGPGTDYHSRDEPCLRVEARKP